MNRAPFPTMLGVRRASVGVWLVWAAVLLGSARSEAQITQDRDPRRPPALEPTVSCDVWRGTSAGNDPTQEVEMRLCETSAGSLEVRGEIQYSSLNSGWTRRSFVGARTPDRAHLTLRELVMLDDRPNPNWRFCLVDRYDLTPVGADAMTGEYVSRACSDHGRMSMRLFARSTSPDVTPPPQLPSHSPQPNAPTPRRRFGCACRPYDNRDASPLRALWALGVLFAWRRARRARGA